MFTFNKDVTATNCEPGVTRKILCYSDDLMMCEIHFEKGSKGNFHSHKHLQITYVAKGSFEFTIGDETHRVTAGDTLYKEPHVMHGCVCLKAGTLLDTFTPVREDFLK